MRNGQIFLRENGYYILGSDPTGSCIVQNSNSQTYYNNDSPIKFLENGIYSCSVSLNLAEFTNFCNNKLWRTLYLFNFYSDLNLVGILGNANPNKLDVSIIHIDHFINFIKNWVSVIDNSKLELETSSFDSTTNTCDFPRNIVMDIIWGRAGPRYDLQNYINSVMISLRNE